MRDLVIDPDRLHSVRVKHALSRESLAIASGVSESTIQHLELGKRPARLGTIRRLAVALGVTPTDIASVV